MAQAVDHIGLRPDEITTHFLLNGEPYAGAKHRKWGLPYSQAWFTGVAPTADSQRLTYTKQAVYVDTLLDDPQPEGGVKILSTWDEHATYSGAMADFDVPLDRERGEVLRQRDLRFPKTNPYTGPIATDFKQVAQAHMRPDKEKLTRAERKARYKRKVIVGEALAEDAQRERDRQAEQQRQTDDTVKKQLEEQKKQLEEQKEAQAKSVIGDRLRQRLARKAAAPPPEKEQTKDIP